MNELSKLISSLMLVGAGFLAASLLGPPEMLDGLANRLTGRGNAGPYSLRPLPANAPPSTQPIWSQRPTTPVAAHPSPTASQTVSEPANAPPTQFASWSADDTEAERGALPAASQAMQEFAETPSTATDEWFEAVGDWIDNQSAPEVQSTAQRGEMQPIGKAAGPDPAAAAPEAGAEGLRESFPEFRQPSPRLADERGELVMAGQAWNVPPGNQASARPASLDANPWSMSPPVDTPPIHSAAYPPAWDQAPLAAEEPAPVPRQPRPQRFREHVVTDGDTLPQLAELYLSDAARAEEIFEMNRDRLDHPDLLPIGLVLRVSDEPISAIDSSANVSQPTVRERQSPFSPISASPGAGESSGGVGALRPIGKPVEIYTETPAEELFEPGSAPHFVDDLTW